VGGVVGGIAAIMLAVAAYIYRKRLLRHRLRRVGSSMPLFKVSISVCYELTVQYLGGRCMAVGDAQPETRLHNGQPYLRSRARNLIFQRLLHLTDT
jgi:hypothetical protein